MGILKIKNFFDNFTSKLIWICIAPVIIGTLMAFGDGVHNISIAIAILSIAIIVYYLFAWLVRFQRKNYLTDNTLIDDIIALIILGPFALAGTYFSQSHEMNIAVMLAGLSPGLLSISILTILHLKNAGKEELSANYDKNYLLGKYLFCLFAGLLMPVAIYYITNDHAFTTAASFILLFSIPTILKLLSKSDKTSLEEILKSSVRILFFYTLIFSLGWIV